MKKATCKDNCLHYDVCQYHIDEETDMTTRECDHYDDKGDYIYLGRPNIEMTNPFEVFHKAKVAAFESVDIFQIEEQINKFAEETKADILNMEMAMLDCGIGVLVSYIPGKVEK